MTTVTHRHSDGIYRNCSRCGKELTDAASREAGVGPICRNKTNDLLAKQIPANLNVASALFLSLRPGDFHDQCEGFANTKAKFVRRMRRLAEQNTNLSAVTLSGSDFRPVVDWIDYSLSFRVKTGVRSKLIEVIEALGYVGLGSVLRGDACMSPATLMVDGDVIKLSGKACTAGFRAMKRSIPGVRTPRWRGDRTPYTASVRHAEKFVEIAVRYWPFIETDTKQVLADAAKAVENLPEDDASTNVPSRPVATISRQQDGWFSVQTPWAGTRTEMTTMLERFKALPRGDRKYNPADRSWMFKIEHHNTIVGIVGARYAVRLV